jgi:hypothetical protein
MMKPDTSSVTFLKADQGGYSVKYRMRDGAGREWVAKLGKEAQSETAAVRLLWAIGYQTEINYLVPCVHIAGAPKPVRRWRDARATALPMCALKPVLRTLKEPESGNRNATLS